MLVVALGAVVAVVSGSDVPLNAGATAVAKVGTELSEESLQAAEAEASKSTAPAIPATSFVLFNMWLDRRTDCYYTCLPKTLSRATSAVGSGARPEPESTASRSLSLRDRR